MRLYRGALAAASSLVSLSGLMRSTLNAQNVPALKSQRIFVSIKGQTQGQFAGDEGH